MKLLIEIPDNYKQRLDEDFDNLNTGSIGCTAILMAVKEGTPIPDNVTNGDMIKAMFPNQTIGCAIPITDRNGAKFYRTTINGVTDFTEDWWNAPYKAESKAELNGEMKAMLGGSFYNR